MAGKKTSDANDKPTRKRTAGSVRGRVEFVEKSGSRRVKTARRAKASATHVPEGPVRLPLTDADMARIDAICAEPPAVTDHMRAAIEAHRKLVRA